MGSHYHEASRSPTLSNEPAPPPNIQTQYSPLQAQVTIPPHKAITLPPLELTSPSSRPPPLPNPSTPSAVPKPRRGRLIIGSLLVYAFSAYSFYLYTSLSSSSASIPQDTDVSARYDATASTFDDDVAWTETITGLDKLRRQLAQAARGHVLETSAGTGRNGAWYDEHRCASLTFVDQSAPMLDIARAKFHRQHPAYAAARFHVQSALAPLPVRPRTGFTTIIQTFGLCSTPDPVALLTHLGTLADPKDGRILLLEHGRGYYAWVNWVLDRTAGRHAVRHGCWWNRDIGEIVRRSGLEVVEVRRRHLGTTWWVELRVGGKGGGRK